jgi:hypothetical protein
MTGFIKEDILLNDLNKFKDFLLNDYNDYIGSISTAVMASSIECSAFLLLLCKLLRPKFIVDLGSGFSSVALRKYASEFDTSINITSADLDDSWLQKTHDFLYNKKLNCDNLLNISDFFKIKRVYDLILYDVAYYQNGTRQQLLPLILKNNVNSSSYILFDDMHIMHYNMFVMNFLSDYNFKLLNTKPLTLDSFGRYCMLVTDLSNNYDNFLTKPIICETSMLSKLNKSKATSNSVD